ncbi:TPA: hypothetical protein N0F65_001525 [Lagenidium giganteum]|uniref:WW domain-containing protein n=1 Tax=Lagenidium giganteum TaxID=4803 RepID=A0AAV2Z3J4_9STRA|nr:TPA: hypothetical protein N0F65_001525 [Lagenidium giganteum]
MTDLPAGWTVRFSRSKGKAYYYHEQTKATQWTRPSADDQAVNSTNRSERDPAADTDAPAKKRQRHEQPTHGAAATDAAPPTDAVTALIKSSMVVGSSSLEMVGKTTFTPWDHQITAVRKLVEALRASPAQGTEKFLFQHSTGSGKSLTIAATAHQMLYVKDAAGGRFHTVVILVDRIKLNDQLGSSVEMYLRRNGIAEVFRADSVEHLANVLDNEASEHRVVITTIQKLSLLVKDQVQLSKLMFSRMSSASSSPSVDRIGLIVDEAHRSHNESTRLAIEQVLAAGSDVNARMAFVGFTATPNHETLHLFGTRRGDDMRPFDCYTISQALQDGRVMNVLEHYTSVRCLVESTIPPSVRKELVARGAYRQVIDSASDNDAVMKYKAMVMMDHFSTLRSRSKMAKVRVGESEPNVSTFDVAHLERTVHDCCPQSTAGYPIPLFDDFIRSQSVRQHETEKSQALSDILTMLLRKLGWNCFAAFSGKIDDTGDVVHTEKSINKSCNLSAADIVIVCEKLDTGYNDPMLTAMYIDRPIRSSTHAVQLLSRLNRIHKAKCSVEVIDFANHPAQLRRFFADYWSESRSRIAKIGDIDQRISAMDLATGVTMLWDLLPSLWKAYPVQSLAHIWEHSILPLERDAFAQLQEAVRLCCSNYTTFQEMFEAKSFSVSERFNDIVSLKRLFEQNSTQSSEDDMRLVNETKRKMSSRVCRHLTVFSGPLSPDALMVWVMLGSH